MPIPQHRKPGSATKARTMAIRAAAIGAVAVPGAALTAHELAAQHPEAAPLLPLDDAQLLSLPITIAASDQVSGQDAYSPTEVESTIHRISAQQEMSFERTEQSHKDAAAAAKAKKTTTVSYTVQEGDSLSAIAERTLGSASAYEEIFALNKDRVEPGGARFTDPSLIQPGWTIALPAGAKTHTTASPTGWNSSKASDASSSTSSSSSRRSSSSNSGSSNAESVSSSTGSRSSATGDLNEWINEAISILAAHGTDVSYNAVYETVMHESGGNPDAVNGEDSNAAEGHPSIGLMQTIQSTFDAYALPGYGDIYNPVDNIIAGARYAAAVYGSLDEMVEARCDGSCWRGY
jgi:hypothetical protein